ncbi:MAG TPA: HypC/HybG/HupF family hydrogenase formation chaperone [Desulfohalobiaceae bacterium]|nr:HypC/HybG/HupF family hydrogenase formation chaperone [Desulfohalobiaceae bacterium]
MCLAVPAEIVEILDSSARCKVGQGETHVHASLILLDESINEGDFVLIHAGFAIQKLDFEEAQETLRLMREMISMTDQYFSW